MKTILKPENRSREARPSISEASRVREPGQGKWNKGVRGYLLVAGLILITVLIKLLLNSALGPESPFVLFPISVLLAAWYGGWGPGLLTAVASIGIANFLFIQPVGSVSLANQDVQELIVYTVEALLFCGLAASLREREKRLNASNSQFEAELAERKRVEKNLRRSEQRFRELADAMPQLVWTALPDGTVDYYNARYEEYGGIRAEDEDRWEWSPVLHPDDVAPTVAAWNEAVQKGTAYEISHRVRTADGAYRWHLSRGVPARDETGQIVRWYGTATDIDREKRAELNLRASEERFAKAFHNSLEPMVITRFESGQYVDINESFARLIGLKREEIIGRTTYDVGFWAGENKNRQKLLDRLNESGRLEQVEFQMENASGVLKTMLVSAEVIDLGSEPHILTLIIDITERKRAEETVKANQALLQHAQAIAHLGSWELDRVENRLVWSDEVYRIFGLEPQVFSATYQAFLKIVHPEDRADVHTAYQDSLRDGRSTYEVEHRIVRPSTGEIRFVHQKGEHTRDATGRVIRSVGVVLDITERKWAEELVKKQAQELQVQADELRELNESLDERVQARTAQVRHLASELTLSEQRERRRIAQILHDHLQQLLYALQLRLSLLTMDPNGEKAGHLEDQLDRMRRLVEEAISTTRRLAVDLSPPVLDGEDLEQVFQWLALQMKEVHGLNVELQTWGGCLVAQKDLRIFLFQIVRELLFNVVKHAKTGSASVELTKTADELVIRIEDEGKGFDVTEAMEKQRLEGGFGLFSVRERLRLFEGNLDIDSAPGQGTRMTIHMPVLQQDGRSNQNTGDLVSTE